MSLSKNVHVNAHLLKVACWNRPGKITTVTWTLTRTHWHWHGNWHGHVYENCPWKWTWQSSHMNMNMIMTKDIDIVTDTDMDIIRDYCMSMIFISMSVSVSVSIYVSCSWLCSCIDFAMQVWTDKIYVADFPSYHLSGSDIYPALLVSILKGLSYQIINAWKWHL
jgi:hypothetical protein